MEHRDKTLEPDFNPKVLLHRLDAQQMLLLKEDAPEEHGSGFDLQSPESLPPTMKEDDEEFLPSSHLHQHHRELPEDHCEAAEPIRKQDHGDYSNSSETELTEEEKKKHEADVNNVFCQHERLPDYKPKCKYRGNDSKVSHSTKGSSNSEGKMKSFISKKTLDSMRKVQVEMKFSCDDNGEICKNNPTSKTPARTLAGHEHLCKLCGHTFKTRRCFDTHMRIHTGEKPFSCDLCGYRCSVKSSLNVHMRIHTGDKPFNCDLCGYRCSQKANLKVHMRIHTGDKPFSCDLCGYRCSVKSSLNVHMRTHTGEKPFCCDLCGYRCRVKTCLNRHMRTHKGEKPFSCDLCEYKCSQKSHLNVHMRIHTQDKPFSKQHHENYPNSSETEFIQEDEEEDEAEVNNIVCQLEELPDCRPNSKYKGNDSMVSHSTKISSNSEDKMKSFTSKKTLHLMRKVPVEMKFSCADNGETCRKNPTSKIHARILGGHEHLCKLCGHTFRNRSNLDTHMRIHIIEKPFSCDLCGYRCSQKANLKVHMRIHTGEKPFTCDVCGYRCSVKSTLNVHMRTHTGEKPFSCDLCKYRCSRKSHLNVHMRIHTQDKPFRKEHHEIYPNSETEFIQEDKEEDEADVNNVFCQFEQFPDCRPNSKYKGNDSMVSHSTKISSNSEDKMKSFTSKKTLHLMRKVPVEMKFSCDDNGETCKKNPTSKRHTRTLVGHEHLCKLCGHTFSNRSNLDTHMRIHTIEKPFSCDLCGYRCSVKSSLNVHMRIHTGDKPFNCDLCGYRCSQKANLKVHMRIHTGDKPFSCDLCGYRCSVKSSLNVHMRTHTGEKPFCCDLCGYRCRVKTCLNRHMRTHKGEKPFSCDFCGCRCSRKSHLIVHMRIHTQNKPFRKQHHENYPNSTETEFIQEDKEEDEADVNNIFCQLEQFPDCGPKSKYRGNDSMVSHSTKISSNSEDKMKSFTSKKTKHLMRKVPVEMKFSCDDNGETCKKNPTSKRHARILSRHEHLCKLFGHTFSNRSNLDTHMRNHTIEKPFRCDLCGYRCRKKAYLKVHMRIHTGEKPFSCDRCGYRCSVKSSLNVHMRTHTGEKPFSCDLCKYRCSRKSHLNVHMRIHTQDKPFRKQHHENYPNSSETDFIQEDEDEDEADVNNVFCQLEQLPDFRPNSKYKGNDSMVSHSTKGSSNSEDEMKSFTSKKTSNRKVPVEMKFSCDDNGETCKKNPTSKRHTRTLVGHEHLCKLCGHTFSNRSNLDTHMRIHTGEKPFSCKLCGHRCSQKSNLNVHMRIHTGEKPFSCDLCGYRCSVKAKLNVHMRTHTGDKPFSCKLCGHRCSQKSNLNVHMRIHTQDKPFSCDLCGYRCSEKASLNVHMRTHTGEQPFSCDLCGYRCSEKASLNVHMRTHKGEQPFRCDICGNRFSRKSNLNSHMRIHTEDKPFTCDLCGYRCSIKASLNVHMRTHTGDKPFSCDLCGYRCSVKSSLNRHMRAHKGEKPFSCDLCGYRSSVKSCLNRHMRIHTGEKPFSCDICGYQCRQKSNLNKHMRIH